MHRHYNYIDVVDLFCLLAFSPTFAEKIDLALKTDNKRLTNHLKKKKKARKCSKAMKSIGAKKCKKKKNYIHIYRHFKIRLLWEAHHQHNQAKTLANSPFDHLIDIDKTQWTLQINIKPTNSMKRALTGWLLMQDNQVSRSVLKEDGVVGLVLPFQVLVLHIFCKISVDWE